MRDNIMNESVLLEKKKAIFSKKNIIVKSKKGDIIVDYSNIKETSYHKKNIFNYIFGLGLDIAPGWLLIKLKEKIGRRRSIAFKIEHEELLKLPNKILKLLMLSEYYNPFD